MEIITTNSFSHMTKMEQKIMDELNDLCENILCPMDLMDSIDEFVKYNILQELESLKRCDCNDIDERIKEIKKTEGM